MSPEKQRIAIAEACGVIRLTTVAETLPAMLEWLQEEPHPNAQLTKPPWCEILKGNKIPDYLHDLNAMHEAEEDIPPNLLYHYQLHLVQIAGLHIKEVAPRAKQFLFHCTAAQRAEAFLKTIGKWEDDSK